MYPQATNDLGFDEVHGNNANLLTYKYALTRQTLQYDNSRQCNLVTTIFLSIMVRSFWPLRVSLECLCAVH